MAESVKIRLRNTAKLYEQKLAEQQKEKEVVTSIKKPRQTAKEMYKELKESRKEKVNPASFTDRYEEELRKQLFEIERLQEESETEESEYYEKAKTTHVKRDGLWDVLVDEEINYFDPDLSYELTGYRPITMDEGLDFDPDAFTEVGRLYDQTGSYTEYPKGSKLYADFWREQLKRCVEGYTVGKYRVTGDHYFFLNFYRMRTVPEDMAAGSGRLEAFPSFHAKQYEFFHYIELCEVLKKDAILLKARGLGFSEMMAVLGVRPYITTRNFRCLYTAFSHLKLDPLLDKCWWQLNWLNRNTNGGMKRLRQKIDNIKQKRASRVTKDGVEFGRMAEIEGIVADTSDKIRGDRVDRLIFEEAGSNKYLISSWIKGNALVELGGKKFAIRVAGGTGKHYQTI